MKFRQAHLSELWLTSLPATYFLEKAIAFSAYTCVRRRLTACHTDIADQRRRIRSHLPEMGEETLTAKRFERNVYLAICVCQARINVLLPRLYRICVFVEIGCFRFRRFFSVSEYLYLLVPTPNVIPVSSIPLGLGNKTLLPYGRKKWELTRIANWQVKIKSKTKQNQTKILE